MFKMFSLFLFLSVFLNNKKLWDTLKLLVIAQCPYIE